MLLNLIVAEFEDLQLVRESRLSGLSLSKEVNHLAICKGLLDVLIVEVDNRVAIRERLSLHSIVEYHLLLSVLVDPLDLSIMPNILLDHFLVWHSFVVVLLWESETEVILFIRVDLGRSCAYSHILLWLVPILFLLSFLVDISQATSHDLLVILVVVCRASGVSNCTSSPCDINWRSKVVKHLVSLFQLQVLFVLVLHVIVPATIVIVCLEVFLRRVVIFVEQLHFVCH